MIKYALSLLLFSCSCIFVAQSVSAQDLRYQQIDSLCNTLYQSDLLNGNVLVAEKGKIFYTKSFGNACEKPLQVLNDSSVFELASCSKQFTAAAIVLLQQEGKLNYDDPLAKWVPELSYYKGVTIRHLLHHTGGLPDYMQLMDSVWDHHTIATNKDVIAALSRVHPEPEFAPGTQMSYSNTGYAMLSSVIEAASGSSYADFLQQNIFKPLGMQHSFVYTRRYAPRKIDNYAWGYVFSDSLHRKMLPDSLDDYKAVYFLDGITGDGTVNSTVIDLLKWDRALYTKQLFSTESLRFMFSADTLLDSAAKDYALGWMLKNDTLIGRIVSHSGGWPGYITYIERHLDQDKTIIILQNIDYARIPAKPIRRILYNQPIEPVQMHKAITLSQTALQAFIGSYELAPGFVLDFTVENGYLMVQATGQEKVSMYPESPTRFFLKVADAQVDFEKDASGKANKLVWHQAGQHVPGTKIK